MFHIVNNKTCALRLGGKPSVSNYELRESLSIFHHFSYDSGFLQEMVVHYYRPNYPFNYGIVKANFISCSSSNIAVQVSSLEPGFPEIYECAILEDSSSYYQSSENHSTIKIKFDKFLLLSHFALFTRIVDNKPWIYPANWSLQGCRDDWCTQIANNSDAMYFNAERKLTPVVPGVYNTLIFLGSSLPEHTYFAIKYIEFFGFTCDNPYECHGNLLLQRTCKHMSIFSIHSTSMFIFLLKG